MYSLLTVKMLADVGLSVDWMTICIGRRGIDLALMNRSASLLREDVADFAIRSLADAVGTVGEHDVFLLADGLFEHDDVEPLANLAAACGVSEETARRKWRVAAMAERLQFLEWPIPNRPSDHDKFDDWVDCTEALSELTRDWEEICPNHPIPEWSEDLTDAGIANRIEHLNDWLISERDSILATVAPTPQPPPSSE